MRLNLFLPSLTSRKQIKPTSPNTSAGNSGENRLGKELSLRTLLEWLGPGWSTAPLQRLLQALSLVLFLLLFFYVLWPYSAHPAKEHVVTSTSGEKLPAHYALDLKAKEVISAELFLAIDPLVSISAAVAGRIWIWSLSWAAVVIIVSMFLPRSFCSFVCPLGTLNDLFDWLVGRRCSHLKIRHAGWWKDVRFCILSGILVAALLGLMIGGFLAAIPLLVRGLALSLGYLQLGIFHGWHNVPSLGVGEYLAILMLLIVPCLGLFKKRFWCRYLCPSGALFSALGVFRLFERKVKYSACIKCDKCRAICDFGAVQSDFSTCFSDCTFCQSCGGVCPVGAIDFSWRWEAEPAALSPPPGPPGSRRLFLGLALSSVSIAALGRYLWHPSLLKKKEFMPIRPPGSLPERAFQATCVRCGECFKVCPNNALQPVSMEQGLAGLWTPQLVPQWSGCEPSCSNCGRVCPTGAIRSLPLEEKRAAHLGLAIVNKQTCLPWASREECQMCADECQAAGYEAIEFERIGVLVDDEGMPIEGSGYRAPVVLKEKCVGCGLCHTRCYRINVVAKKLLTGTAISVRAGATREDRLFSGSYLQLREREAARRL